MGQLKARKSRRAGATGAGRRIYELLRSQIVDGTLAAGAKVPSTRALANDLGVSRTTVTAAYEQLASEGYLETSPGTAARVCRDIIASTRRSTRLRDRIARPPRLSGFGQRVIEVELPTLSSGEGTRVNFLYGAVAFADFPTLAWRRAYQHELLKRQSVLYYAEPKGESELRRAVQGYLGRARGLVCEPNQIVILHGSQQAIDLCARLLVDPGDPVVIEDPSYLMARRSFEAAGARLLAMPVDEHGLVTERLPTDGRIRLAYVTPSHQFPLGGVMPFGRRRELLQWAARCNAYIVEDDYDGEFRYGLRPIDALQAMDQSGSVIYVGTFSKALSPQLRLGYVVLPPPLVSVFQRAKSLTDRHAPRLEQLALGSLIASGAYERHVRRLRRENERRRTALLSAIARYLPSDVAVAGAVAGLHVVVWLPSVRCRDESALVAAALAHGIGIHPITPMYADARSRHRPDCAGLILGYASLTPAEIERGIRTLGSAVPRMRPNASR